MDEYLRYLTKIERNLTIYKRKALKSNEFSENEMLVLHYIRHHEGCTLDEIRGYYEIDKALVTRIANKLEKKGLLEKKINNDDLRSKKLYSTKKAAGLKNELTHLEETYYDYLFLDIAPDDKKIFLKTLEMLYIKSKKLRKNDYHEIIKKS